MRKYCKICIISLDHPKPHFEWPSRKVGLFIFSPLDSCVIAGPVVTDNGNFIIDAPFGRDHMIDPFVASDFLQAGKSCIIDTFLFGKIMAQIKMLTGVVEVGLFCKMARAAYFGNGVSKTGMLLCTHSVLIFTLLGWLGDCTMERWKSRASQWVINM